MSRDTHLYGAIEAGGTKFVCALLREDGSMLAESRLPTADPQTTLEAMVGFLKQASQDHGALSGIGIASFGPIVLDRQSPHYGSIGKTPKPGWSHTDIISPVREAFACPIGFDTDVNAAALAEHRWGAGAALGNLVYITVGTGIGGGVLINGSPLHGLVHPEIGHISVRRHPKDNAFSGVCPFHGDCLEGLASGSAIFKRSGRELALLGLDHPQWEIEADYLGQLCATLVLTLSPQRIILGGGVMNQEPLFPLIRQRMLHWLAGYVDSPQVLQQAHRYVVPPGLGARAGIMGALALAVSARHGAT